MASTAQSPAEAEKAPAGPGAGGWWLVFVLMLLYTLSYLDRQIISLMVDPIRRSLDITEFEISLVQGASFAIFFAIFGLPMGWAADRLPRRWVIFAGVFCWSIAASAGGFAHKFWQLAAARFALGAGEAGLMPAGYSLIADRFPPHRFGLAMSIFAAGGLLGGGAATLGGALLIAHVPSTGVTLPLLGHFEAWQFVFLLCGLPCLLLSPIIFTVGDPGHKLRSATPAPMAEVWRHLRKNRRFYTGHFLGFGLYSACGFCVTSWLPTFLMRHHKLDIVSTGAGLAAATIAGGLIGVLAYGALADRLFAGGRRDAHLKLSMLVIGVQTVIVAAAMTTDNLTLCFILLALYFPGLGYAGAAVAALQLATPAPYRGRTSALYLFVYTLLGVGCGPSVTAFFTEYILQDDSRIGLSIIMAHCLLAPLAIAALGFAAPAMRRILKVVPTPPAA